MGKQSKGGLLLARHNELRDEVADHATKAFSPNAVRDDPLIYQGRTQAKGEKAKAAEPAPKSGAATGGKGKGKRGNQQCPAEEEEKDDGGTEEKGDLLIRDLWKRGTDCILDMRVVNTDSPSYGLRDPEAVLRSAERAKKRKYLQACLDQRRHFTPFVCSVDGLVADEAKAVMKRLAGRLASRWSQPYSQVCGFLNARVAVALVRATHRTLRGSRVPASRISVRRPQWEDGAGLHLFR